MPSGLLPLVALLITAQLVGPILGSKLAQVGPLVLDGALVLFPISYICGDALTEVFGYRLTRRVIWVSFGCQLLVVLATGLVEALPPAPGWDGQQAFSRILGTVPRMRLRVLWPIWWGSSSMRWSSPSSSGSMAWVGHRWPGGLWPQRPVPKPPIR